MKRIVVYQSGTGFTARYAGWIAEELGCEVREYKNIRPSDLAEYDMVIYGGWIMANMVFGYDKIKTLGLKNLVVFGVGMTVPSEEVAAKIAEQNQIPKERFFYFEGGYHPEKLGFAKKMMMNMIKKSLEKKEEKTAEDLHMLETFKGADHTDKGAIKELIAYCM
ncbi:MAG: flavodoxin domain-containing protein [Lachnospiraceae bacterium]|nr:flavodoxin domain-containing protein [Lachnospiraceae bacterium]